MPEVSFASSLQDHSRTVTKGVLRRRDGLYRIETDRYVAGFVIEQGRVTMMAPILRRLPGHVLKRHARRIGP